MSTPQDVTSPSRPRVQQHRSATRVNPSPRRPKGSRANTPRHAPESAITDGEVISGEELPNIIGLRNMKKHTQSQPASDRLLPSADVTSVPGAAVTDSELSPRKIAATPARSTAYAGPTFHASPAASALPIPKFLSRSVQAKPRMGPPSPEEVSDSASSVSPSPPSPSRAPIPVRNRDDDSPLNLLFKAHREEQARKGSGSPGPGPFSPLAQSPARIQGNSPRPASQGSANFMFPIELDADNIIHNIRHGHGPNQIQKAEKKYQYPSPPVAAPYGVRSVTAPSKIPQVDSTPAPNDEATVFQDLMSRLSQSQKRTVSATPPRSFDHAPLQPTYQHQTPSPVNDASPFNRASGPITPTAAGQDPSSDFHYGNRNLSPLFKAAQGDASVKRNSGLRTEIKADYVFPPVDLNLSDNPDSNSLSRMPLCGTFDCNALYGSVSNIPQIPPFKHESPTFRKTRTPGRRPHYSRPDSFPHMNKHPPADSPGEVKSKPAMVNPFIPASVKAKQFSTAPKAPDKSTLSLEQDLKRMLKLNTMGEPAAQGVR